MSQTVSSIAKHDISTGEPYEIIAFTLSARRTLSSRVVMDKNTRTTTDLGPLVEAATYFCLPAHSQVERDENGDRSLADISIGDCMFNADHLEKHHQYDKSDLDQTEIEGNQVALDVFGH